MTHRQNGRTNDASARRGWASKEVQGSELWLERGATKDHNSATKNNMVGLTATLVRLISGHINKRLCRGPLMTCIVYGPLYELLLLGVVHGGCLWGLFMGVVYGGCLWGLFMGVVYGGCLWGLFMGVVYGGCLWGLFMGVVYGGCLGGLFMGVVYGGCFRELFMGVVHNKN